MWFDIIPLINDMEELHQRIKVYEELRAERIVQRNINKMHEEFIANYKSIRKM